MIEVDYEAEIKLLWLSKLSIVCNDTIFCFTHDTTFIRPILSSLILTKYSMQGNWELFVGF